MDESRKGAEKVECHVVCLPVPAQSHIGAMLNVAKLLHHRGGCHVSFVNTEYNHRRMLQARHPAGDPLLLLPRFQFLAISDGLPPSSQDNTTQSMTDVIWAQRYGMVGPFLDVIADINRSHNMPRVSCIVSDGFMSFTAEAASHKYHIPFINLWTISACSLMGFMHYPALIERRLFPPKDEDFMTNGYLETRIDWIPGMKDMRLRDLPSFLRTRDENDTLFTYTKDVTARADKATANIIHTFEALEQDVLDALSSKHSTPFYAVGPLHILFDKISEHENHLKHLRCNLWKEEVECLDWLNSQKLNSVLYINFGSITHLTHEQLVEFAMGIAYSEQPFLWIIRPDLVKGETTIIMPPEFIQEIKDRGMVSSWCPQEEVLNHPSIKGFLTHCGWSSILESLSAGVPMLCWPYFCDQQTNCKYTCSEWMAGLEIVNVMRDEVELLIRELMIGDKGKQLKLSVINWKKLANQATSPHGSSSRNLDKLLHHIL